MTAVHTQAQEITRAVDRLCAEVAHARAALDQCRGAFAARLAAAAQLNALQGEPVACLDVGGHRFHTRGGGLRAAPDHFLSILSAGAFAAEADEGGYLFVDRDPTWFPTILGYLRHGTVTVPRHKVARRALRREGRFYGLPRVVEATLEQECVVVAGQGMVQTFSPETHTWHAEKLEALRPVAAATVGGELYVATRATAGTALGHVARLDRRSGGMEGLGELPPHFHVQAGVGLDHHFLLLGFVSIGPRRLELRAFDVARPSWSTWGDMAHRRQKFAACVLEGRVVVLGGRDLDSNPLRTAEEYQAHEVAQWRPLPDMGEKRSRPAAVVWGRLLVVVGGYNNEHGSLSSVEAYDPALKAWRRLPSMRTPRIGCQAVVLDGELVVLGGLATGTATEFKSVERYNQREDCWEAMPSMCEAPIDPCVAVLRLPLPPSPDGI